MKKATVFFCFLFLFCFVVIDSYSQATNSDYQRLVGTWVWEDGSSEAATHFRVGLVLNADGTYSMGSVTDKWGAAISTNTIVLPGWGTFDYYFSPNGNRLILYSSIFGYAIFVKRQKTTAESNDYCRGNATLSDTEFSP